MSAIFGGSKQSSSSTSSNKAYGDISNAFRPLLGQAQAGMQGLSSLLGGDASGLNMFKKMTGFNAAAEEGSRGITGNAAASGLLQSGSTGKALQRYGNEISNQYANSYMDRLLAQAGLGLQAGNVLSGAGQTSSSKSSGKSKDGMGGFLGSMAGAAAASDVRLKKNIHKVGELDNGLNVYQYRYIKDDEKVHIGVMAQEVAKVKPEALGPELEGGYMTVDYGKLGD